MLLQCQKLGCCAKLSAHAYVHASMQCMYAFYHGIRLWHFDDMWLHDAYSTSTRTVSISASFLCAPCTNGSSCWWMC